MSRIYVYLVAVWILFLPQSVFAAGEADDVPEAVAIVEKQGLTGAIDAAGKEVLPVAYAKAVVTATGQIAVMSREQYGVYDRGGREIVPPRYRSIALCRDGSYILEDGEGKWGAVSGDGKPLLSFKYTEIYDGDGGVFCVRETQDGGWQLVKSGDVPVTGAAYSLLGNFSEGMVAAGQQKWGFLKADGSVAVPLIYEEVRPFSEGKAAVKTGGRWGFVDAGGSVVIPPQFSGISQGFQEGLAVVTVGKSLGVIDEQGKLLFKKNLRALLPYQNGLAEIRRTASSLNPLAVLSYGIGLGMGRIGLPPDMTDEHVKRGFIDRQGKEVISSKYDAVGVFSEGFVTARKGKKWGALDQRGQVVLPFRYILYEEEDLVLQ